MGLVYKMVCKNNGLVYIGQTVVSLKRRSIQHISKLRYNNHPSKRIQDDFNLFGNDSFIFETLEETSDNTMLDAIEQKYIESLKSYLPSIGYNKERGGKFKKLGAMATIKKGTKLSNEHVTALSNAKKNISKYREIAMQNAKKISVVATNILSKEDISFNTMKDCAEYLGVSRSCVRCHIVRKTKLINKQWVVKVN